MQIKDYLYGKDLYQLLMEEKPEEISEIDWKVLGRKTLSVVRLSLSLNVLFNISKETTIISLMETLANMYENPYAINKVHLMHYLFNLRMTKSAYVAEHFHEFNIVLTSISI